MPTIEIDRDTAREAAERELAKPIYPRPSLREQLIDFVDTLLQRMVDKGASVPGGWFTISVLVILTVVAVVAAVRISRRTLRGGAGEPALFGAARSDAADHRAIAQRCAAAGDWAGAIRHRLRAAARELEQSGVIDPAPGRTATELARTAGAALPELAGDLTRAAQTFNDVSYGELPATEAGYRLIAGLDETLLHSTAAAGRRHA